jgi:hypothetical protein
VSERLASSSKQVASSSSLQQSQASREDAMDEDEDEDEEQSEEGQATSENDRTRSASSDNESESESESDNQQNLFGPSQPDIEDSVDPESGEQQEKDACESPWQPCRSPCIGGSIC